ncbi:MAG: CotH kinase family protein [Planctomycetes bacterium]|nr:CotH kinase family protein [Planctomycetota bacterium]
MAGERRTAVAGLDGWWRDRWIAAALAALAALAPGPAAAQIAINEVLASNRDTNRDEDDDSSDWLEITAGGAVPISLLGYGLTNDIKLLHKWVFPDIVISPGEYLLVWCSGKDRFESSLEAALRPDSAVPFRRLLVSLDAEWRYLTGPPEATPPPEGWEQLGFDDSSWASGKPGFGYGDNDDATILPFGIGAVFLRHVFVLDDPDELTSLILQVKYDDGFIAYLNGEHVASSNEREGEPLTFASRSSRSHEASQNERFDLNDSRALLRRGENVLAMVALNATSTSNDLSLIPQLGTLGFLLHANFAVTREGEAIFLSDPSAHIIDRVYLPPQIQDRSFGRSPDGTGAFLYHMTPTPAAPNAGPTSPDPISIEPAFAPEAGWYPSELDVEITASIPLDAFEIRYTTNGTAPSQSSALYTQPIRIARSTVIRAGGFFGGEPVLRPVARSYFLSEDVPALPVISISMPPQDFQYIHLSNDGHGMAYERAAHMDILRPDGNPGAGSGFGLRLHGGAGRGGDMNTKKSYRAYFRSEYGAGMLEYPIIPDAPVDRFDSLVLRGGFNDAFRTNGAATFIRDELIRALQLDMGHLSPHGAWYHLYVNAAYRGIYNVVERIEKDFLASYYPEDGDRWDVIRTFDAVAEGTSRKWGELRTFMATHDFADDDLYAQACGMIDIENFTDYMILNIWAQNHDWPHNNWYAACPQRADGKWIFLSWDAEFGIGLIPGGWSSDTFAHVFSKNTASLTVIFSALLENPGYRRYFLDELDRQLAGALAPENVLAHIRRLRGTIAPDMSRECALAGQSVQTWRNNVAVLETFAGARNPIILRYVQNNPMFALPRVTSVNPRTIVMEDEVEVSIRGAGFTPKLQVSFGEVPSPRVTYRSVTEVLAVVPFDVRVEGSPVIAVSDPDVGGTKATGKLKISFLTPNVTFILPAVGAAQGGDQVSVIGEGFAEGVRVEFGGVPAPSAVRVADRHDILEVVTPPGSGTVGVVAINVRPRELPSPVPIEFTYLTDATRFIRGDADGDGTIALGDAVAILVHALAQGPAPPCQKTADVDDNGFLDLGDGIQVLAYLFVGGSAPRPPFPACGLDPTEDDFSCEESPACP